MTSKNVFGFGGFKYEVQRFFCLCFSPSSRSISLRVTPQEPRKGALGRNVAYHEAILRGLVAAYNKKGSTLGFSKGRSGSRNSAS